MVVRYETPSDAPIFQAERELTMRRCTFRADGPPEGSRFVLAEGRKATIDGCLFEGFDTAVHVEANRGMSVSLARSIFLSAKPGDEAIGRAIRVHSIYGQGAGSRLSIEDCSSRSGTFLDVGNFTPATPLEVEVVGSALLVKALLSLRGRLEGPARGRFGRPMEGPGQLLQRHRPGLGRLRQRPDRPRSLVQAGRRGRQQGPGPEARQ